MKNVTQEEFFSFMSHLLYVFSVLKQQQRRWDDVFVVKNLTVECWKHMKQAVTCILSSAGHDTRQLVFVEGSKGLESFSGPCKKHCFSGTWEFWPLTGNESESRVGGS